jgi:hypothetical protein
MSPSILYMHVHEYVDELRTKKLSYVFATFFIASHNNYTNKVLKIKKL